MSLVNTGSAPEPNKIGRVCLGLSLVALAVLPVFAVVGYARSGWAGILAALLASGVCCGGAIASLAATWLFRVGSQAVSGILLGMIVRMGLPLAACVVLIAQGGWLVEAGAPAMILVYYLLMLVAETWWLLRLNAARVADKNVSKVS
jgi:hypothetical protein